jgi:sugar O-acyltransferase (sialic acid O-acetyltransferase NeuD family)
MNKLIGVYGASGFGRETMPILREMYKNTLARFVFIDDAATKSGINGHDVLTFDEFCDLPETEKSVCLAIANSRVREKLSHACTAERIDFVEVRAANTTLLDNVEIGEGAILSPFVMLTSNIRIGRHFHANIYSYVAHDCRIGDFVTFAPAVKCNGNVTIEDHAYIGTGAIIRQGSPGSPVVIGEGAIVGMGAVVTKSVPAGTTVVGNPARPFEKA